MVFVIIVVVGVGAAAGGVGVVVVGGVVVLAVSLISNNLPSTIISNYTEHCLDKHN